MSLSLQEFSEIKPLGIEGMENIFLSAQKNPARIVVLKKLLSFSEQPDPQIIKRLENQVLSARELDHQNIVKMLDFGMDSQSFFVVMEYVDGFNLGHLMRWSPFPEEIGLMVLLQTIKGLQYAHTIGKVHYNIKPSNILIAKNGKAKIADFGLDHAKPKSTEFNEYSSDFMTLNYMPPEVAGGQRDRTISMDIWSVGVLAYQIICGTLPFKGASFPKLVRAIVNDTVNDIRSEDPSLPEALAMEINACLEKNPNNRPESVDKLGQYVDKFLFDIGIHSGEEMIKKYLIDKNAATEDIEKFVVTYYEKKSGASKNSDISPVPTPKPGIHDTDLLWPTVDKSRQSTPWLWLASVMSRKKMSALIGIVLIVAGTLIVMLLQSGHRRQASEALAPMQPFPTVTVQEPHQSNDQQAAMPPLPAQTTPSASAQNVDSENLKQSAPIVSSIEKKPRAETAPSGLETKLPSAHPASSITYAANPKKKSAPSRIPLPRMRKSTVPVDNSNIAGGEQPQISAPISPPGASEDTRKGIGTIHIYSYPWAEIYIDDAYQGTSPTPKPISLPEGNHTLVLKRDGFKTYSENIHIAKDEEQHVKVQLEQ